MYVLEARQLRKSFGEGEAAVEALRGVDLGVSAGEMLAIMGRSGSGKSTLLTLLGGVDVPTSGQIVLEGTDLATLSDDGRTLIRRRRIGFATRNWPSPRCGQRSPGLRLRAKWQAPSTGRSSGSTATHRLAGGIRAGSMAT